MSKGAVAIILDQCERSCFSPLSGGDRKDLEDARSLLITYQRQPPNAH